MTEKERTHFFFFFFFFFFARVRVYPMMRFFVTFEAKRAEFWGRFQRKIERKCTHLLYRERR